MKIPLYHMNSEKDNVATGKNYIGNQSKHAFEIENSVEIHLKSSARFLIPILIVLWMLVLLILFLVHNILTSQIESQKLELENLKYRINTLNEEVLSLTNLAKTANLHPNDTKNARRKEGQLKASSLTAFNETTMSLRQKRDATEETKEFKNERPAGRKFRASGRGKNSNQSYTRRRNKVQQSRRLHQCEKCLRANNTKYSDFQTIHLKGAHPENVIESGHVGPWFVDTKAVTDTKLSSSFQLREDGQSIEIKSSGLYFIYAQVYYLTSHAMNSFTIKLVPKDSDSPINLALCSGSTVADKSTSEISCYTAVVQTLQAGDRIHVQQREKHRRLIMRPGHTFLGLIKLGFN